MHWGYWIAPTLMSLVSLLFFIPSILYHYSFCMNVGEFTKAEFIQQVTDAVRPTRKTKEIKQRIDLSSDTSGRFSNSRDLSSTSSRSSSSGSRRSSRSMSEIRKHQDENLKKILPAHPRTQALRQVTDERHDSLHNLFVSRTAYSSSSSSE